MKTNAVMGFAAVVAVLSASTSTVALSARAEETASVPDVVWVKADKASFEAHGAVGDGSEENPFNTIQAGVDNVAVGGTVKIMAGTYDNGEQVYNGHANRVVISKKVILDGVGGKDGTHIVGKLSTATAAGFGNDTIRCIRVSSTAANGSIIRNLTLRNGGSYENNSEIHGGAVYHVDNSR